MQLRPLPRHLSRALYVAATLVVVSHLSPHAVAQRIMHEFERQRLTRVFHAEGAAAADLNNDGHMDIVAGPWWYEGPDFTTRHALREPRAFDVNHYSDNFLTFVHDFNGDGRPDVLAVGWPGEVTYWYANPGPEVAAAGYWPRHTALTAVDNESPLLVDLTGDGRPELVCSQNGRFGFAAPDPDNPYAPWRFVRISDEERAGGRYTHGLGVGDIDGDGRLDLIEKNGWWRQPENWDGSPNWMFHPFAFSEAGGAQMLVYDVNGDGLNDVITSLSAHAYGLAWYEQMRENGQVSFIRHDIITDNPADNRFGVAFSQLHALALADIDGDGLMDIVTGKRFWAHNGADPGANDPAVLYWFQLTRSDNRVEFIPHLVDDDSGVGTQVVAADVNGDGLIDILVANKKGTFLHLHRTESVDEETWLWRNHPAMKSVGKTPQRTAAEMSLPDGFRATLFAGEPDIHQPIAFAIDHRGRLWVAENYSYPHWSPTGRDRIVILEDTDGDGLHDRRTLFYDQLNFVSGIEVGFGGVFVGSPPHLLFIPDRDGDDVPDGDPQVLLDGWGHQDTHETLNSFTWGPDGWLYGCHGVFTHSNVGPPGAPDHERQPINAGIWRYHPLKKRFEVFAHGTSNPWGVDFDAQGQCFLTCCVIPHAFHIVQGGRYERQAGQHFNPYTYEDIGNIVDHAHFPGDMRDWDTQADADAMDRAGGGHAHAGAMIYQGDNWPAAYRGRLFMNNIHGNRINQDRLTSDGGSGYIAGHEPDFMHANDKWYRGLAIRCGPDGGVFVCDWYDQRACHQQQPHDRTNGRVYKITYGSPAPVNVDLSKLTDLELVDHQQHPNAWHATTARRVLMERPINPAARAALWRMFASQRDTPIKLRSLWTLHAAGGLDESDVLPLLHHEDPFVRAWAIQISLEDHSPSATLTNRLSALAERESSPIVRKYLAAALQRLPLSARLPLADQLLQHSEDAQDHNIPKLIWYGVEPLVRADPARAMDMAGAARLTQVRAWIVRRAAAEDDLLPHAIELLARAQTPADQVLILDEITRAVTERGRAVMPANWDAVYERLSSSADDALRRAAVTLAVRLGDRRVFPAMRALLADPGAPIDDRLRAIELLASASDPSSIPIFQALLDTPALRAQALRGLMAHESSRTPVAVLRHYDAFTPDERRAAIALLTTRPTYAAPLLDAVESGRVPRGDVHPFELRQMLAFGDDSLSARVRALWGAVREPAGDKQEEIARWKQLLTPTYLAVADRRNGRAIFDQACAPCHRLFSEGAEIGPDLTGANRADLDYILENILDPNAVIGPDYQVYHFELEDGRILSALILQQTDAAYTLQTPTERFVVPKADIIEMRDTTMSMMPEGLLDAYQDSDVRDLIAYLASPAQVPPPNASSDIHPRTGPVESTLEGESLRVISITGGRTLTQDMTPFAPVKWSGDAHLWWIDAEPGARLALALPPVASGRYEVIVYLTKAPDYAIVRLSVNGRPAGEPIDLFNAAAPSQPAVVHTGPISLGVHDLQGPTTLEIHIIGAHPQAIPSHMFALDYVKLVPAK